MIFNGDYEDKEGRDENSKHKAESKENGQRMNGYLHGGIVTRTRMEAQ